MTNYYNNERQWRNHYRSPYLSVGDCDFLRGLLDEFRAKLINRYR